MPDNLNALDSAMTPNETRLVPVSKLEEARDLLMARIYGSAARSPCHNARLLIEDMISARPPREEAPEGAGGPIYDQTVSGYDRIIGFRAQPQPEQGEASGETRDYPAEFEAWWATYRHRNRGTANYSVKKQIAFDAFYHASLIRPAPVAAVGQQEETKRVRHKKRGTEYTIIGVGRAQGEILDDDPVVLYRGDGDGGLWVRHQAEFSDGRFEYITTPDRAEALDEGAAGRVTAKGGQWEPHTGQDYAVVMLPDENTETASIHVYSDDADLPQRIADALNAHPSPTPAADDDRLRVAVEALEPFASIAGRYLTGGLRADLDARAPTLMALLDPRAFYAAHKALAALKAEVK